MPLVTCASTSARSSRVSLFSSGITTSILQEPAACASISRDQRLSPSRRLSYQTSHSQNQSNSTTSFSSAGGRSRLDVLRSAFEHTEFICYPCYLHVHMHYVMEVTEVPDHKIITWSMTVFDALLSTCNMQAQTAMLTASSRKCCLRGSSIHVACSLRSMRACIILRIRLSSRGRRSKHTRTETSAIPAPEMGTLTRLLSWCASCSRRFGKHRKYSVIDRQNAGFASAYTCTSADIDVKHSLTCIPPKTADKHVKPFAVTSPTACSHATACRLKVTLEGISVRTLLLPWLLSRMSTATGSLRLRVKFRVV